MTPHADWTREERAILARLNTPWKVQEYLDAIPYNTDHQTRSPRRVLRDNRAHCMEGALFAAVAAQCASDQGKFWEYHDNLMEALYTGRNFAASVDSLKQAAASLGLDAAALASCLDGGKYTQRVQEEAAEAQQRGVTGTPAFFVNDTLIVGAKPFAAFETAIDAALAGP